jgi:DNA polymerase-1
VPRKGKPTKTWPEGNPGLSKEDLGKIDHPGARLLVQRSELYGQLTKFLVPITERTVDGRISTSFSLTGTVTGRLSSRSPGAENPGLNSQQIPRDRATRNLFGERGQAWIEVDFSQLELRVAAVMANEPTMIGLFEAGEDIHMFIAQKLVKDGKISKHHRTLAKGVNFGFLYGMQAKHFADYVRNNYGVIITPKEAHAFREEYFNTFSALPAWYRRQRREAIEHGGVHNEFGRFRHLPRVYNDNFWVQENAFRQAINSPVQSTGSDFMLISLGRLAHDLRLQAAGAKLLGTVHDSVLLTAPYKTARRVGRIVKETMEQADDTLTRKFFLKADVTISRCWGGEPLAEF